MSDGFDCPICGARLKKAGATALACANPDCVTNHAPAAAPSEAWVKKMADAEDEHGMNDGRPWVVGPWVESPGEGERDVVDDALYEVMLTFASRNDMAHAEEINGIRLSRSSRLRHAPEGEVLGYVVVEHYRDDRWIAGEALLWDTVPQAEEYVRGLHAHDSDVATKPADYRVAALHPVPHGERP